MKFIKKHLKGGKNNSVNMFPAYGEPRSKKEKDTFDNRLKSQMDCKTSVNSKDTKISTGELLYKNIEEQGKRKFQILIQSILKPESGKHGIDEVIGIVVSLFIMFFMMASLIVPDKHFSERENRILAQRPHISIDSIIDGSYMQDMGTYSADQFLFRNMWISMRTGYRNILGKYDSNGVYKGDNEYLFEDIVTPDNARLEENIYAVNALAIETGIPVKILLAPDAASTLKKYLPKNAPVRDQNQDIDIVKNSLVDGVGFIDVRNAFAEADPKTQLYYRTDHHWTTDGSYIAFMEAAKAMELDTSEIGYDYYALANDFSGTLAAKSGFSVKKDTIKAFIDNSNVQYVVEYTEEAKKTASVYDEQKLKSNDKYAVFFGGNHTQVKIRTNSNSERRLLVIKDSYANSFVPFLIPYYREIVMVDPRYYSDNMREMMKSEGIGEVLFLYNGNTFFEDSSMSGVVAEQVSAEDAAETATEQ